jgi:hypothetical protein
VSLIRGDSLGWGWGLQLFHGKLYSRAVQHGRAVLSHAGQLCSVVLYNGYAVPSCSCSTAAQLAYVVQAVLLVQLLATVTQPRSWGSSCVQHSVVFSVLLQANVYSDGVRWYNISMIGNVTNAVKSVATFSGMRVSCCDAMSVSVGNHDTVYVDTGCYAGVCFANVDRLMVVMPCCR